MEMLEVIYRWPDGREEVRYRRPNISAEARRLESEVGELTKRAERGGYVSPYSIRIVDSRGTTSNS